MKKPEQKLLISGFLSAALAGTFLIMSPASNAQEKKDEPKKEQASSVSADRKSPTDPLRTCVKMAPGKVAPAKGDAGHEEEPQIIISEQFEGKYENPQEKYYREEIIRLLKIEIKNVNRAIHDVETKHKVLIKLYPQFESYQEIILEDVPGAWRSGEFVNARRTLSMGYGNDHNLDCMVLDSTTRNVYNSDLWTRKILRMRDYSVQTLEMETLRHNYRLYETFDNASPEVQLRAFRLVYQSLRTALYSMDMLIAAYYEHKNRKNYYQINL
ncbi:MAG: hypothetical protein HY042_08435 [Spirochaetia bacterium]|nr:hypothetical protein [Spirochaetia bacterium]